MSKKSKRETKEKNLQAKRARKAANRAKYAELRRLGINGKSKRSVKKKDRRVKLVDHSDGHCGNIACKKCFPDLHYQM